MYAKLDRGDSLTNALFLNEEIFINLDEIFDPGY
jgi:hypothetical protein